MNVISLCTHKLMGFVYRHFQNRKRAHLVEHFTIEIKNCKRWKYFNQNTNKY